MKKSILPPDHALTLCRSYDSSLRGTQSVEVSKQLPALQEGLGAAYRTDTTGHFGCGGTMPEPPEGSGAGSGASA